MLSWAFFLIPVSAAADHPIFGFGTGVAGPINTITPHVLSKGSWSVGVRVEQVFFDAFSNPELRRLAPVAGHVDSTEGLLSPFVLAGYGVTSALTVAARLPYVVRTDIREAEVETGQVHVHTHGDSRGLGDLSLFAQYRLLDRNGFAAALLGGVNVPTGATSVIDNDRERFEIEHQPGAGAWSSMFGIAAGKSFGRIGTDWNVLYSVATEGADRVDLGNLLNYNVAMSYRIGGDAAGGDTHDHASHTHVAWDLVAELNGEHRQRLVQQQTTDLNTGGLVMYLAPGVRASLNNRWFGYVSIGIPLVQDLHGIQHRNRLRLVTGLSVGLGSGTQR